MPRYKPIAQRFQEKYVVNKKTGCWEWQGTVVGIGYGMLGGERGSAPCMAHRFSYELYKGSIPAGMIVCHRCDNPGCVNPEHLYAADHHTNMRDMALKGRARALTSDEVMEILDKTAKGATQSALAREYGVSRSTIDKTLKTAATGDYGGAFGARGSKSYTILPEEHREEVRRLAREGRLSVMEIAKRFHIDRKTVRNLRDGKDIGRYSKLTKEEVLQIIICWEAGLRQQQIADLYGIDQTHVSRIVRGTSWAGVKQKPKPPTPKWAGRKGQLPLL